MTTTPAENPYAGPPASEPDAAMPQPAGLKVEYAPDFSIVLTRRCSQACAYCNFPRTPSLPLPSRANLRRMLKTAARLGATQVTFLAGEGIEMLPEIVSTCRYYGYKSWWQYLKAACETVLEERGQRVMLPVLEVGPIPTFELAQIRDVVAAARVMLDLVDERLLDSPLHSAAPRKAPSRRMAALEDLGRWGVPVTTGLMIGLGESAESRERAVTVINGLNARHGNVQNFVLKAFRPFPHTALSNHPAGSREEMCRAVAEARAMLDPSIMLSAELPTGSTSDDLAAMIQAGANDLGAFCMGGSERFAVGARSALDDLQADLARRGLPPPCERAAIAEDFATRHQLPMAVWQNLELYHHTPRRQPGEESAGGITCKEASADTAA